MPERKLILSHKGALMAKYIGKIHGGRPALTVLGEKLNELIAFDGRRSIETIVVFLDEDDALVGEKVIDRTDERQFKNAIDKAYNAYHPNYMVILGAQDIVPFIVLHNPLHPDIADEDRYLPTDLPYACNYGYSQHFVDFLTPTRVVARIPDVYHDGDKGIQVLVRSLDSVMQTYTKDAPFYNRTWAACTCKRVVPMDSILRKMYPGNGPYFYLCPPYDYHDFADKYIRSVHLHILHGDKKSSRLFGEDLLGDQPVAVKCEWVNQNINLGTIVLERACYGGQLYNPHNRPLPLVNMYLSSGAACVIGSTIPTYSNRYGLALGDYLMAGFYKRLYNRTTGAAFLATKQWLITKLMDNHGHIDSGDISMFASFNLYGDPSLMPMASRSAHIPQANYPLR